MVEHYFNYIKPSKRIFINNPKSYKVANQNDIDEINHYAPIIQSVTKFYDEILNDDKIDYVFKENNSINILPVRYKRINFSHLTGINFAFKSGEEKFNLLKNGNNTTPIIIERYNHTIEKLQVLNKIPELLRSESTVLTQLQKIKQANRIGFSRALNNKDNSLLLALENFQPEFYQPKSLLNITNKNYYQNLPKNTILAVFREKSIPNGIHVEPISLNENALDNMATTTEMLIGMQRYADELGRQLTQEKKVPNRKELAKKAAFRKRFDRERD